MATKIQSAAWFVKFINVIFGVSSVKEKDNDDRQYCQWCHAEVQNTCSCGKAIVFPSVFPAIFITWSNELIFSVI